MELNVLIKMIFQFIYYKKIEFKHPVNRKEIVIKSRPPKDVIWNTCI